VKRTSVVTQEERIKAWAGKLTARQARTALAELVERCCETEELRFWEGCLAPFWETTGDPLVEGQRTWPEDD
jgi:hypothetical protein